MADDNLSAPAGPVANADVPKSFDQTVEDITGLLDAPATDHVEEAPAPEAAPAAEPEDDPLGLTADAEDDDKADPDVPDGPQDDIKGGRFAPDTAKVTLDDGSVITVAELKRNNLYHAGFTQKTQALTKDREVLAAERKKVADDAQSLSAFRDYAAWYAETFIPKRPEPFNGAPDDYVGFIEWQKKDAAWHTHAAAYQAFQQHKAAEDQRKLGETAEQAKARLRAESEKLVAAIPILKDPAKAKAFRDTLVTGAMEHFGITEQEVNTIGDSRFLLALREAVASRRNKAKAATVQTEVLKRPAMRPGQRQAPSTAVVREKQAQTERFHKSGNFDDGVAILKTML